MAKLTDDDLDIAVQAYYDNAGNKSEAARSLGLKATTYKDRLIKAEKTLGLSLRKVADGRIEATKSEAYELPAPGEVKRYFLTSIQNNTHLHPGFNNILAYVDWLDDLPGGSCELIIGTYSYQLNAYGPKAVKRGTHETKEDKVLWYAREAEDFIIDHSVELAPGLVWCGEQNILPTTKHPLTSFEDYNGRKSNIVPHAKISMESVAAMATEAPKLNYSTGTITQRNYIQKRAGILAEQKHTYGGVLVEIDSNGSWWVRQVEVDEEDALLDVGPEGFEGVRVQTGKVTAQRTVDGIYWGDTHVAELDTWVRDAAWGRGGMLDVLRPKQQFMGDIFSMRSRSPHEMKDFLSIYKKRHTDEDLVEEEIQLTTDFVNSAMRKFCETVIIPANHDRHLERWLNEADFRQDPGNAKYFLQLNYQTLDAVDNGTRGFNILEWAMVNAGLSTDVTFLKTDESCIQNGIENGLHGDLGPNGSRGSTRGLTKLGRKLNKGHDHSAAIRDQVYGAGVCSRNFSYQKGPHSHSVSHILNYINGKRAIVTMWNGKWRA